MSWRVAIDRGGTFTDVVAWAPDGGIVVRKVPTDPPGAAGDAALDAVRELVGVAPGARIPASRVASVRCGTTAATNALLERRGERHALLVTRGFADLLAIGTQERPELFALRIVKPAPLAARVVEVDERVLADGIVRRTPDRVELQRAARMLRDSGFRSAAVLFLHSYAYPAHELLAGEVLRAEGFEHVSLSHLCAREIKAVPRGETACADAYLTPVLRRSLERFRAAFDDDVDVRFMQSHGGLADARHAVGPRAVVSGPAGGVVAVAEVARRAGEPRVIGFDMGGTSTDACRWAGALERVYETRAAGLRLQVPSLRIVTVAAGGGSRLGFDGWRLTVGPESAGAEPGPAGYGRGGPATITDADAVLGRLVPDAFPRCFGADGQSAFDVERSRMALAPLAAAAGLSVEAAAAGFVRVANERMAQAIREVSVLRGYDVREHALVCFGGAGGQHACAVAAALGMRRVLVPPLASVLSAWGVGLAAPTEERSEAVLAAFDGTGHARAAEACARLAAAAREALVAQGVPGASVTIEPVVEVRTRGVDATIDVALGPLDATLAAFADAHRRLYGFAPGPGPVEVVTARARATAVVPDSPGHAAFRTTDAPSPSLPDRDVSFETADGLHAHRTPVLPCERLADLGPVDGPALLVDDVTTVVVEPGWRARAAHGGAIVMEPIGPRATRRDEDGGDPVSLALFANAFMSIAERMGGVLERVSHSTNIKERLDFSCAVFDGDGRLVANAPHIPVHLGAMGESVRAIAAARGDDLRDGDVFVTNDPYRGGSHLPDITAVTPVRVANGTARFFVANRAHHADVGGISPGSMPPLSRSIDQEGARVHDLLLVRDGVFLEDVVVAALGAGPWPARGIDERMADLRAQAAANAEGARLLAESCEAHGESVVAAAMGHVLDAGAGAMQDALSRLPLGVHRFEDALDDGTPLVVAIIVAEEAGVPARRHATLDFAGTGPRSPENLNAPRAVTRAAVLYALRTLVRRDVPLNEGCLRDVEIRIPAGSLLDPIPPDAVVGGNVETSMRIVDLVLGALGAAAASQGTMNNLTFGGVDRAYYETIGGGAGAGPDFDGASAVQCHMTNTRITDVEVLETRFPVLVRAFAIRRGSGGAGRHRGGDGTIREIEFLAPIAGGILSERRARGPFGLAGGASGAPGRNVHIRGGVTTVLPGRTALSLLPGDVLRIETPGGGGCGPTSASGA